MLWIPSRMWLNCCLITMQAVGGCRTQWQGIQRYDGTWRHGKTWPRSGSVISSFALKFSFLAKVLYESHSVLHGRPFPLKGKFMANLFIHFEPTGHSLRHNARIAEEHGKDVHEKYRDALKRGVAGHENDNNGLPSYITPGSAEESHWRKQHPFGQVRFASLVF